METAPRVHRQRHSRRSEIRQCEREQQPQQQQISHVIDEALTTPTYDNEQGTTTGDLNSQHEGITTITPCCETDDMINAITTSDSTTITTTATITDRKNSSDDDCCVTTATSSQTSSQQTVLLVNGHAPPVDSTDPDYFEIGEISTMVSIEHVGNDNDSIKTNVQESTETTTVSTTAPVPQLESPTQHNAGSSRNSSGDAMSLRETLQQLPRTIGAHRHRHRNHSPHSPSKRTQEVDASFHRGILGFMDRELKQSSPTPSALSVGGSSGAGSAGGGGGGNGVTSRKLQSLSDPQASPAQRSVRSRSSLDKSPRRKRSKSESRRRRERKLIAAGEMEVRQANETLMRYLKQCSEMNDASLSGELEIDQNFEERRVHRKTKSQRDKRGHIISKLYTAGGLSSILRELSDDIVPAEGDEIYNPFTPVVSPTEDTPAHIDKMFMQTSSGYRPVEHCYYKHTFMSGVGSGEGCGGGGGRIGRAKRLSNAAADNDSINDGFGNSISTGLRIRASSSYSDTRYLLDTECQRHEINTNIQLACVVQRIWLLISNVCHGLLAGLALAHLLFVLSNHSMDWSNIIHQISLVGETTTRDETTIVILSTTSTTTISDNLVETLVNDGAGVVGRKGSPITSTLTEYASFANIYLNTFYCLAIMCMVSVLDRIDICRWDLSHANEFISFRWLIIAMIYSATIILTLCSDSIHEKLYYNNNMNVTLTQQEMLSNSVLSVWSSLSVTRSIGAICGWIMIGLTPQEDLLYEHLIDLTKYQLTNN